MPDRPDDHIIDQVNTCLMHFYKRIMDGGAGGQERASTSEKGSIFEEMKDQVMEDTNTVGIAVGLLVGFITLMLLFIWTRRKSL